MLQKKYELTINKEILIYELQSTKADAVKNRMAKLRHAPSQVPVVLETVYRQGLVEGTVLEFRVTTPDGKVLTSNMKVSQADLDLLKQIQDSFS